MSLCWLFITLWRLAIKGGNYVALCAEISKRHCWCDACRLSYEGNCLYYTLFGLVTGCLSLAADLEWHLTFDEVMIQYLCKWPFAYIFTLLDFDESVKMTLSNPPKVRVYRLGTATPLAVWSVIFSSTVTDHTLRLSADELVGVECGVIRFVIFISVLFHVFENSLVFASWSSFLFLHAVLHYTFGFLWELLECWSPDAREHRHEHALSVIYYSIVLWELFVHGNANIVMAFVKLVYWVFSECPVLGTCSMDLPGACVKYRSLAHLHVTAIWITFLHRSE